MWSCSDPAFGGLQDAIRATATSRSHATRHGVSHRGFGSDSWFAVFPAPALPSVLAGSR